MGFGSIVHLDEQQLGVELSGRKQCLHCQYIHVRAYKYSGKREERERERERIEDRERVRVRKTAG